MAECCYEPCAEPEICNRLNETYFEKGDYEACFRGYLELAEQGYPPAEYRVGSFYHDGLGVEKNLQKALYWIRRAAKHGDRDGQYKLAGFYEDGIGAEPDLDKAKYWYLRAAWQKHEPATEKCRELNVAVYKVRLANEQDKEEIYQLKSSCVRPYAEPIRGWEEDYQRQDFDKDFAQTGRYQVIEVDGILAGYVQYTWHEEVFEICELHLAEEYRGKRIGTNILTQFKELCIAQDRKVRIGCFRVNHRALAMYKRLDFMVTEETATHYILQYPNWRIIPYEDTYRDDMIFMVLQAKDALGRIPKLNEDLLDIHANYLNRGDMFWLAVGEQDRVIGCIGYNSIPGTTEARLHRLYVKADRKHQGIGTGLLHTAEIHLRQKGKTAAHVHLGGKEYYESRSFYPKHGYYEYKPDWMKKELC